MKIKHKTNEFFIALLRPLKVFITCSLIYYSPQIIEKYGSQLNSLTGTPLEANEKNILGIALSTILLMEILYHILSKKL